MPQYKLTYFDVLARGEPTRLIFAQAGVEYEEVTISILSAEWPKLKPKMLMGALPLLEVDGKQLFQSHAIERFLGKRFGMAGKDDFESALCDMYIDGITDAMADMVPWIIETDPEKKAEAWNTVKTKGLKPLLEAYEKVLAASNSGFFVGDSLTWADITIFHWIQAFQAFDSTLLEGHPKIQEFQEKIGDLPRIKKRVESRTLPHFVTPEMLAHFMKMRQQMQEAEANK